MTNDAKNAAHDVRPDAVTDPAVIHLIQDHVDNMREVSPPESTHVLPLGELRAPEVSCWSLWVGEALAGFAALKELPNLEGEVKSMRTAEPFLRRGVAATLLETVIDEARSRGYKRLSLETGSYEVFAPARALYERYGFEYCGPFGAYKEDPNSSFMSLNLIDQ